MVTGGRIPLGSALPDLIDWATGKTTTKDQLIKITSGLISPTGGMQIKKSALAYDALKDKGVYMPDERLKYPIEVNKSNATKGLIFGTGAFPETKEYYDKNRRPLGAKQTEVFKNMVKGGQKPQEIYNLIPRKRAFDDIKKKAKSIMKSEDLTSQQKEQKLKELLKRLPK